MSQPASQPASQTDSQSVGPIEVPQNVPLHVVNQVVGEYGAIEVIAGRLAVVPTDPTSSRWIFTTLAVLAHVPY